MPRKQQAAVDRKTRHVEHQDLIRCRCFGRLNGLGSKYGHCDQNSMNHCKRNQRNQQRVGGILDDVHADDP